MRWGVLMTLFLLCHHPDENQAISPKLLASLAGGGRGVQSEHCQCVPFYQCSFNHIMTSKSCNTTEVCCENNAAAEDICGWGITAAKHAHEAEHGEFPWMVAILNVEANENWTHSEYVGGGAIIHPTVVVTAAHKVDGKEAEKLKCRAGEWIRVKNEQSATQERLVEKVHLHPNYERLYTANDIALLFLKEKLDESPTVRPVCIGKGAPPQGSECFAMGWGRHQFNSSNYAEKLKKVSAPLVPRTICWRALQAVDAARQKKQEEEREKHEKSRKTVRGEAVEVVGDAGQQERCMQEQTKLMLHSSLLCAGGEGEDTCTGDGGSPLVCQLQMNATHTRYAVYGLVAWGVGCGVAGSPGVYVDVAQYYDWITDKFAEDEIVMRLG